MNSAIYRGWVRHRRYAPRSHAFTYRMFMLLLDLDETQALSRNLPLFGTQDRAPVRFRRSDHWGDPAQPLKESILDLVEARIGTRPKGSVRLLTQPRVWGIGFNPISVYYCYGGNPDALEAVVAEVTNTPWRERMCYVLPGAEPGQSLAATFDKAMHVSPFMPMDQQYRWRGRRPGKRLAVHLESHEQGELRLDATLSLQRLPLTSANLASCLVVQPLSTVKVTAAIHWEALRLVLKRVPFHPHPGAIHGAAGDAFSPRAGGQSQPIDHRKTLETPS